MTHTCTQLELPLDGKMPTKELDQDQDQDQDQEDDDSASDYTHSSKDFDTMQSIAERVDSDVVAIHGVGQDDLDDGAVASTLAVIYACGIVELRAVLSQREEMIQSYGIITKMDLKRTLTNSCFDTSLEVLYIRWTNIYIHMF